jgi:hypothetical protein
MVVEEHMKTWITTDLALGMWDAGWDNLAAVVYIVE